MFIHAKQKKQLFNIKNMFKACFKTHERVSCRRIKNMIRKASYKPYLINFNNEMIGFVILKRFQHGIHIEYLGVLPSHQGKGYGKRILELFNDTGITLECTNILLPFYEKMGFKNLSCFRHYNFMYKGMTSYHAARIKKELYLGILSKKPFTVSYVKGEQEELVKYEMNENYYIFIFRDITKS